MTRCKGRSSANEGTPRETVARLAFPVRLLRWGVVTAADHRAPGSAEPAGDGAALPGAGTPEGETLAEAWEAFDRGEWATTRQLCDELRGASPEVARAARRLRRRAGVDRVQLAVLGLCLAIFLVIVYVYVA